MARRVVLTLIIVAVAYGVGWLSDAVLNGDPCVSADTREVDRYDPVARWFPARTDCRVTTPSGATRIERGSPEIFLAMFAFALVVGCALLSSFALVTRAAAVLIAGAAAFLVIFIV